ncbi:MAG: MotA/TolQ/ExbB proton channel family protein [Verrucomicrobiaceae bacterium]|nr:MotA/TolQ/ExbB proton channel family protein [Verrucomicrobiaceae bacterium]
MSGYYTSAMDLNPFIANGLSFAFEQSSTSGIAICVALFVLSSFSWTVMITKFLMVRRVKRQNAAFIESFQQHHDPLALWQNNAASGDVPVADLYRSGSREILHHLTGNPAKEEEHFTADLELAGKIKPSQMNPVECAMEQSVSKNIGRMESQMGLLATAVSGAPFLGLLGTVWGVMDTFSGVATASGAASMKTMAPGVSAALLTTVIALLVAIPAMFGYNYLVNTIKSLVADLDNFRNELHAAFERWYVDHGRIASTPTVTGRRLSASDLVNGTLPENDNQPGHRIVKRAPVTDDEHIGLEA